MKISKLLNKNYLSIFVILFILLNSFVAAEEEPVDIWNLEKKTEENKSEIILQDNDISADSIIQIQTITPIRGKFVLLSHLCTFIRLFIYQPCWHASFHCGQTPLLYSSCSITITF